MYRKSMIIAGTILLMIIGDVGAETLLNISARAGGKFGAWEGKRNEEAQVMVKAFVFKKTDTVIIKARGRIELHPEIARFRRVTPLGLRQIPRRQSMYTALEEAVVDKKGFAALAPTMDHVGALIGAFTPEAEANRSDFKPWNDYFGGDISADKLLLIGSGPRYFTAPVPGMLFLGINDTRYVNNSGNFKVRIDSTP